MKDVVLKRLGLLQPLPPTVERTKTPNRDAFRVSIEDSTRPEHVLERLQDAWPETAVLEYLAIGDELEFDTGWDIVNQALAVINRQLEAEKSPMRLGWEQGALSLTPHRRFL